MGLLIGTRCTAVQSAGDLSALDAIPLAAADETQTGFQIRVHQVSTTEINSVLRAERQLAGELGPNIADLRLAVRGAFRRTLINFDAAGQGAGSIFGDERVPGIPGRTGSRDNFAVEISTYLAFPGKGQYQLGVSSDDGFRLTIGGADPRDLSGTVVADFDGGRAAADTIFTVTIPQPGLYPARLIWEQGTGDASLEWFSIINGERVLINGNGSPIRAYRSVSTARRPVITDVHPRIGSTSAPPETGIEVQIESGDVAVDRSTITLVLNGVAVVPTVTTQGLVTVVSFVPSNTFPLRSTAVASVGFREQGSSRQRTLSWTFQISRLDCTTVFIEAEDFDFGRGQFFETQTGMDGPYAGGRYQGLGDRITDREIDYHEQNESNDHPVYRPLTGVEAGKLNQQDRQRSHFEVAVNHVVGWNDAGDWYNYTRVFPGPARQYRVFASLSSGGAPINASLSMVTSGVGTPKQATTLLGVFNPGQATAGWDSFELFEMTDANGRLATVTLGGQQTLRWTVGPGNHDFDYLAFVPVRNTPAPALADQFEQRRVLDDQILVVCASTDGFTTQPREPRHAGKNNRASGWITWQPNRSGVATLSLHGSDFDTLLAVYRGMLLTNLTEVASSDDSDGAVTSLVQFNATAGTAYQIAVSGLREQSGRVSLFGNITPAGQPIPELGRIIKDPPTPSVLPGTRVTLTVPVLNLAQVPGLRLQWFHDGQPIPGATGTNLVLPSVTINEVGGYVARAQSPRFQTPPVIVVQPTLNSEATNQFYEVFAGPAIIQINTAGELYGAAFDKLEDRPISSPQVGVLSIGNALRTPRIGLLTGAESSVPLAPFRGFAGSQQFSSDCVGEGQSEPCAAAGAQPGEPAHCGQPPAASMWFYYAPVLNGQLTIDTRPSLYDTICDAYADGPVSQMESLVEEENRFNDCAVIKLNVKTNAVYAIAVDSAQRTNGVPETGTAIVNYSLALPEMLVTNGPAEVLIELPKPFTGDGATLKHIMISQSPRAGTLSQNSSSIANRTVNPNFPISYVSPRKAGWDSFEYILTVTLPVPGGSPTDSSTTGVVRIYLGPDNQLDFNGDSKTDLIMEGQVNGNHLLWSMDGFSRLNEDCLKSDGTIDCPQAVGGWRIVGSGFVNGDAQPDLVWQSDSGHLATWYMNGTLLQEAVPLEPASPNPDWRVVAVGDLDRNGSADLLFQATDSRLHFWLMDGNRRRRRGEGVINHSTSGRDLLAVNWRAAALSDFNADGYLDVIFQYSGSDETGELVAWLMQGTTYRTWKHVQVGPPPKAATGLGPWKLRGSGDFDRDGAPDLIFQYDDASDANQHGTVALWLMNLSDPLQLRLPDLLRPARPAARDEDWRVVAPR